MNLRTFTPHEVESMAEVLLKSGLHPSKVRKALALEGVHWEYQFLGQGRRERLRRLRHKGKNLCSCGQSKYIVQLLCSECLEKKWKE